MNIKQLMSGLVPKRLALEALKANIEMSLEKKLTHFQIVYIRETEEMYIETIERVTKNGEDYNCRTKHAFPDGKNLLLAIDNMLSEQNLTRENLDIAALIYKDELWTATAGYRDASGEKIKFESLL